MRRVALLSVLLCACGLTVRGSAEIDGGTTEPAEGGTTDSAIDGGVVEEASVEAEAGPACLVEVTDDFNVKAFDPAKWITTRDAENGLYPLPYFTDRPQVMMLDPTKTNARGGLWYVQNLPFDAFDVELDVNVVCQGNCGDGLAVFFLEKATANMLNGAQAGAALGAPSNLDGAAVSVDLTENAGLGDGDSPAVQILELDKTKVPAQHPWVNATSAQILTIKNATHRLAISMRNKTATVKLDGAQVVTGTMNRLPAEGTFGFGAASGGYTSGIYLGDLRAKFYRCNAP